MDRSRTPASLRLAPRAVPIVVVFLLLFPAMDRATSPPGTVLPSAGLAAQPPDAPTRPPMYAGGSISIAQPRGEFAEYVDLGFGLSGFFRLPLDEAQIVSLRADFSVLAYGRETQRVCLTSCLIQVDLTTSNNIVLGGLGPELGIPLGTRARLYANLGGGFSYFATTSTLEPLGGEDNIASTTNFSDFGFAWKGGSGVSVEVWRGDTPVSLDLGLDYQGNGRREYLTPGDITERPDGSLEFDVRRSDADFLLWRIGVSVGLRPRR